jgi:hypothetical protein
MFCASLKEAREKRGVSLEAIATSTKIARSLLKGLEDNDLSRWPKGLYRRSYLRDYLSAVGLPQESLVADFARLFPDDEAALVQVKAEPAPDKCVLSMTLVEGPGERVAKARRRFAVTAVDTAAMLVLWGLTWWLIGADIWASATVISLGYYSLGTMTLGRSFGSRWLDNDRWKKIATQRNGAPVSEPPDTLLARLRGMQGLPEVADPSIAGELPLTAPLFRTLFLP